MDFFTSLDRNGPIDPIWFRVVINFGTKNSFELNEIRRMLEGENGLVDFSNLIHRPSDMVHFLSDEEYASLPSAQKEEYDKAEAENRIGDGWERINWGCDINADDARWVSENQLKFDVTNGIPKPILEKLAENLNELGVGFRGFSVPNKFGKVGIGFFSDGEKVEYFLMDNQNELICEEWDISKEEMEEVLYMKRNSNFTLDFGEADFGTVEF